MMKQYDSIIIKGSINDYGHKDGVLFIDFYGETWAF
jgi:hypothetical protein